MILFLIGMPGCGKSTLGKELSLRTEVEFHDLDELIIQYTGMTIPELINSKGEDYFRRVESTVLSKLDSNSNMIVATGGGTPCFHDNMLTMKEKGRTVFLETPLETLKDRLLEEGVEKRPLLPTNPGDLLPFLEELHETRLPFYLQAEFQVQFSDRTLDELAGLLIAKS